MTRLSDDDHVIRMTESADMVRIVTPLDAHFFTKFSIRDSEQRHSFKTLVDMHLVPAMVAMSRCLDMTVMEKLQHHQGDIAVGVKTSDIMLNAHQSLNERRAFIRDRQAIIPPAWEVDLLREDVFIPKAPPSVPAGSSKGRFLGFDTYTDPTCKQGIAFHRQAAALICRPLDLPPDFTGVRAKVVHHNDLSMRCVMMYNVMHQCVDVTLDMLTGTTLLDENLVCRMNKREDGINMFKTASQMN